MENAEIGSLIAEGLISAATVPAPEPSSAPAVVAPAEAGTPAAPAPVPASAAPLAAPVVAMPSAPAAPVDDRAKPQETIPLPAFLDMRDENKKLKAKLAELEKAVPATPMPTFKDDPDAFAAYMAEHTNRIAMGTKFDVSEMTAREKHGDDKVTGAMEWGMQRSQQSPAFAADYLKQKNPIDWIVRQHKQANLITEVGDDPDAWVRKRAEELGYVPKPAAAATTTTPTATATQPAAAPASPQPAPSAAPPRSIATAPSAGGPQQVPTGPLAAFDAVFPGP